MLSKNLFSARKRPIPYHRPTPSSCSSYSSQDRSRSRSLTPRSWTRSRSRSLLRSRRSNIDNEIRIRQSRTRSPSEKGLSSPESPHLICRSESPQPQSTQWTPPREESSKEESVEPESYSPPMKVEIEEQVLPAPILKEAPMSIAPVSQTITHSRPTIHHIHPSLALLHHARPHGGLSLMPEPIIIDPYHPLLRTPLQRHIPGSYYSPYLGAPYC